LHVQRIVIYPPSASTRGQSLGRLMMLTVASVPAECKQIVVGTCVACLPH